MADRNLRFLAPKIVRAGGASAGRAQCVSLRRVNHPLGECSRQLKTTPFKGHLLNLQEKSKGESVVQWCFHSVSF